MKAIVELVDGKWQYYMPSIYRPMSDRDIENNCCKGDRIVNIPSGPCEKIWEAVEQALKELPDPNSPVIEAPIAYYGVRIMPDAIVVTNGHGGVDGKEIVE